MKPEKLQTGSGGSPVPGSQKRSARCLALIAGLLLAGLALSACGSTPTAAAAAPAPTSAAAVPLVAQGHLEPRQFTDLSFIVPGQVSEVLAAEGAQVQAGQPIARLAGREARLADLSRAKQEDLAAQQALVELRRGADDAYALALQAQANAQTALDDAQRKRTYMDYIRGSKDQIAAANADYYLTLNDVDKYQDHYNAVDDRPEDDPIRALALANLQTAKKNRDRALINANYYKSKPTPKDIALADANLARAEADLKTAQDNVTRLNGGPDPELLAAAQGRAETAKAALASAQAALDALELRAPTAGSLAKLDLKTGQFVSEGQPIATLIDFSTWTVKTDDLTELNVVKVKNGEAVSIKLDALPEAALTGVVNSISSTYYEKQGDVIYTVKIALKETRPELRWGMTAEVHFDKDQAAAQVVP